jgi:hypothetical protein
VRKRLYAKKYPFLIQNEPFEYGLKIKNIGSEPFSGATIVDFTINSGTIIQPAKSKIKIKALNVMEEYEIYFDKYTLWHEGSISTQCALVPDKPNEIISTYQYHKDHDTDEIYRVKNQWWHDFYCQSQQQLLQTRTNNLILLLTVITVVEAVFGLKETAKTFILGLAWVFHQAGSVLAWLVS